MLVEIRKYRSSGLCGDWEQPGNKHTSRMNGTPRRSCDARNMEASFQKAEEQRIISCNANRYYLTEMRAVSRIHGFHPSHIYSVQTSPRRGAPASTVNHSSGIRFCLTNAGQQEPSWPSCVSAHSPHGERTGNFDKSVCIVQVFI